MDLGLVSLATGFLNGLLENLVLGDLLAWQGAMPDGPQLTYWRTTTGDEVDFVVESADRLLPIEVKGSTRPRLRDAAGLAAFLGEYDGLVDGGLLLHAGSEVRWLRDDVLAAPWWRVL